MGADGRQTGQRQEIRGWMFEPVAHRHQLALAEQDVIDGLLNLEDVDVQPEIGVNLPQLLDDAGHDDMRAAGDRAQFQLDVGSAFDAGHRVVEIVDLLVDAVDLHEKVFGFRHWHIAALPPLKQPELEHPLCLSSGD
jgi:hypothetical protein